VWEQPVTFCTWDASDYIGTVYNVSDDCINCACREADEQTIICHAAEGIILALYVVDVVLYYCKLSSRRNDARIAMMRDPLSAGQWDLRNQKTMLLHSLVVGLMVLDLAINLLAPYTGFSARFSRPLRPILLVTKVRWLKEFGLSLLNSMFTVIDTLIVPAAVILMFAIVAVISVPLVDNYPQGEVGFHDIGSSFLNMLVVLTTENYPDIMHNTLIAATHKGDPNVGSYMGDPDCGSDDPSKCKTPDDGFAYFWCLFYCIYMIAALFILCNLVLAIVWDAYKLQYRTKTLRSRMRDREALLKAFMALDYDNNGVIERDAWHIFIRHLLPKIDFHESELMFDMLDVTRENAIGPFEFVHINDLIWLYQNSPPPAPVEEPPQLLKALRDLTSSRSFIHGITACTYLFMLCLCLHTKDEYAHQTWHQVIIWVERILVGAFSVELLLRSAAFGPLSLFSDWAKAIDTLAIIITIVAIFSKAVHSDWNVEQLRSVMIFRMLRVLQPWAAKATNTYHLLVNTIIATFLPCCGLLSTLIMVMYAYAIVGCESFHGLLWAGTPGNPRIVENFNSFMHAMLLLFQLLIVNNWNTLFTDLSDALNTQRGYSKHTALYPPALYYMSFLGVEVCIVANVVSVVVLIIFATSNKRQLASRSKQSGMDYQDSGERAARMWTQSVERTMLEAVIEEEREEILDSEMDSFRRIWQAGQRAVDVEGFAATREKLIQDVRRFLGEDMEEEGNMVDASDQRALYIWEAQIRLYDEELNAPRKFVEVDLGQ